ncbi:hypothetical protein AB833_03580 [Chromatiales bacterium (ex Bugula neritina AB1)]|nr:hypothetical protein AB833_03580 [Chromatiales bacterium (ex Bugula neritina AB1)]
MSLERRQYARIVPRFGDVVHPKYKCLDLSEIGMRFSSPVPVGRGENFTVVLTPLAEDITLHCRVIWCRELVTDAEDRIQFGVVFEGFSMARQLQLRELIRVRGGEI